MQVQIKRSEDSSGVMFAPTEEEAMRKIKEQYPGAVSVAWEPDYDRLDPAGRPKGQIKLVYENPSALGHKSGVIARIRKYS